MEDFEISVTEIEVEEREASFDICDFADNFSGDFL